MTAPKKTRTRKSAVEPAASEEAAVLDGPIAADGTFRPVRIGQRGAAETVTLFELDGVEYKVPARPSAALVIRFFRQARDKKIGAEVATENLMIALLGQEAFDALAESPEVTTEDVADVFAIVAHLAYGSLKAITDARGN